jgi:hypothetical protein
MKKGNTMSSRLPAALAFLLLVTTVPAVCQASFHLWKFDEVFSNPSGTVQFIEMVDAFSGEEFVGGMQLKSNSNTFTVPANLPSASTANHHMLFATAGFGSLPNGVTPDYIIPASFFNPSGDTLDWAGGFDHQTFGAVPTDGVMSVAIPGGSTQTNSPTNFAGSSGSVSLAAPEPLASTLMLMALPAFWLRRRRWRRSLAANWLRPIRTTHRPRVTNNCQRLLDKENVLSIHSISPRAQVSPIRN